MSRFVTFGAWLCLSACGGLAPQSGVEPRPSTPRSAPHGVRPTAEPTTLDADPDLARDRRVLIGRTLAELEARPVGALSTPADALLLQEVFGALSLDATPPRAGNPEAWVEVSRVRHGRPRLGDLAVFADAPGVPRVGVVAEVHPDGRIEVVAQTRAAWRRVVVHPEHRNARRMKGQIVNTFLRARHPDDPPRARYLAGQLLTGFRTLLD
jgi:hypothetical protein